MSAPGPGNDTAGWENPPTARGAWTDHEVNPEYELHLGQIDAHGTRTVSIWLRGARWSGHLRPTGENR
jgi:hypothetical protein